MEYTIRFRNSAITLVILDIIALLVIYVDGKVRGVQYAFDLVRLIHDCKVKFRRGYAPFSVYRNGRVKIRGVKFRIARHQPKGRVLLVDRNIYDVADNHVMFIAKKNILVEFKHGRPCVTVMDLPIKQIREREIVSFGTTFAHNLFDTIIVHTESRDAKFVKMSDLALTGAELFIRSFGRMFYLNRDTRAYLTNTHMCLENGTRVKLYHINNFASPVVNLGDGIELELKWEFYQGCGHVLYIDINCNKKWSNIDWMICQHYESINLRITRTGSHDIISEPLCPNVIFCRPISDTLPTFHDGMLVWLGHSRDLALALIQAERSASYPVMLMLEYCTINCNVYINSPNIVRYLQIGEQVIAISRNLDVRILRQIGHTPDINKCVGFEFGQIRGLRRLQNGRIVFSSGFNSRVYHTTDCFDMVEQVNDNALILNGITYYFGSASLLLTSPDGRAIQVQSSFPWTNRVRGSIVNGACVMYRGDEKIVFRDITEIDPRCTMFWIEQVTEGRYVAMSDQEYGMFDGYTETNTGQKTKAAIR